jgi:hypothetical protein
MKTEEQREAARLYARQYRERNKERLSIEAKKRYQANKQAYLETKKRYYQENKESIRVKQKEYQDANRAVLYAKNKEWREANLDKVTYNTAKRRALKALATPAWYDADEVRYIYALAKEKGLHVDHIVPLKHPLVCGLHVQDNLRCIPKELNLWKSNKLLKGVRDV